MKREAIKTQYFLIRFIIWCFIYIGNDFLC